MALNSYLVASALAVFINSAHSIGLKEAYELALTNDPTYVAAIKGYEAGLENKNIGRASLLPKVTANYNQASNRATQTGAQFTGGPNVSTNWSYPSDFAILQVTQPLFSLDSLARWKQGIAQTEFSQSQFLYNTQDLLIRVLQAYTDYLFSIDQWSYLQIERQSFSEQAKASRRLYEKGEKSITDALEAESAFFLADARLIDAADGIELNRGKLNAIIGRPVQSKESFKSLVRSFPFLQLSRNTYVSAQEAALVNNQELRAAANQVEVARQEYKRNDAGHYPVLNMVAAATTQSSNTVTSINQTTNQNYIGLQLSLPIYSGNEVRSKTAQAYANYEKIKAEYEIVRNKIFIELRKQYDLVQSGAKKINALSNAQASAEKLVDAMTKGIKAGESTQLDVLIAEKNLYVTRRDLAQSKYNYLIAFLKVKQLTGEMEVEDLYRVANYFK
jgi:protease secretion system outer membrane protein